MVDFFKAKRVWDERFSDKPVDVKVFTAVFQPNSKISPSGKEKRLVLKKMRGELKKTRRVGRFDE